MLSEKPRLGASPGGVVFVTALDALAHLLLLPARATTFAGGFRVIVTWFIMQPSNLCERGYNLRRRENLSGARLQDDRPLGCS